VRSLSDPITLLLPRTLAFGIGCAAQLNADLLARAAGTVFVVTSPPIRPLVDRSLASLVGAGVAVHVHDAIAREPTVGDLEQALAAARDAGADAVVGIGGGSAMDVAKLVAALLRSDQRVHDAFGIGKLGPRATFLACLPTTAGTGSEVSPNAILLDERENLKKGVISPHLVPDAAYVDPALTFGVPRDVTAATGIDALSHCIEAYANRFAHPVVDGYAIEGIRQVALHLPAALQSPADPVARSGVALGSLYGGICLGPVNTGAAHALAYPLGSEFHVSHGVSIAVLLPHVLAFNLEAAPDRYADIAVALGVARSPDPLATARAGIERLADLVCSSGVPTSLRSLGVPRDALPRLARAAMTVTRLLERNVRPLAEADALALYERAYS
jgi:alcohol dehydrogenase class IV